MEEFYQLTNLQQNILIASIIGDGEITKFHQNSRRKNNSYREHYGINQLDYRKWKVSYFPNIFCLTEKSKTLRSKSMPLFTKLYPYFYNSQGEKIIPTNLLQKCNLPYFFAILYMDDGTLSVTKRINHNNNKIYLTPHVALYLQCFPKEQLELLKEHILKVLISISLFQKEMMAMDIYYA